MGFKIYPPDPDPLVSGIKNDLPFKYQPLGIVILNPPPNTDPMVLGFQIYPSNSDPLVLGFKIGPPNTDPLVLGIKKYPPNTNPWVLGFKIYPFNTDHLVLGFKIYPWPHGIGIRFFQFPVEMDSGFFFIKKKEIV